jgi:hypothetical protein
MSFGLSNHSMKIQESIETLTLKVGVHLRVWVHSFTFSGIPGSVYVTPELHSRPSPFHALTLVVNPKLGL